MIIGVFLRNFKTYSGINYIPLTNGNSFCGLVGNNGIGKSSVLEAFDCLFNSKPWNYNIVVKKSGLPTRDPYIVPVYLLSPSQISDKNIELFKAISNYAWNAEKDDILSQNRIHFESFLKQRNALESSKTEDSLLIPIGLSYDLTPNFGIFNTRKFAEQTNKITYLNEIPIRDSDLKQHFLPLHNELKELFEYIYIPKDIDLDDFTQLETKEIQSLMGKTLNEIVEECVPPKNIEDIKSRLNKFINSLSDILGEYSFRTVGERQVNLKKNDVYKLIIDAYFKIRKLHKKEGKEWLELNVLSSGEKQKAIIELAFQFLNSNKSRANNLIIAIDEPESSLHMSACYDQFNKLFEMSTFCSQLLFTTHWYGFIPTVDSGYVSVISKPDNQHHCDLVNIGNYRESIKQSIKQTKGELPYDIRLKSLNDFIQSIITSLLSDEPYNWLICEGSSEKIYFEAYFSDIKKDKKLRIIPVGGAAEIRRIYNNLQVAYEDFKKEIKGKVILVSDTDSQLVQYPTKEEFKNLICRRIVNEDSERKTILVKIDSNPVSPKTEIEDALNGKLFFETLKEFKESYPELLDILSNADNLTEESTYFALDLSPSKQKILENFFNLNNNKFNFSKKYVEKMSGKYKVPEWIEDIRNLYYKDP